MRSNMPNMKKQRGLTLISWLFVMAILGFFVLLTLRLVPIYTNHFSVKDVLMSLESERDLYSFNQQQVLTILKRKFNINRVIGFKDEHFSITLKDNGNKVLRIAYEDRRNIMGNVDVIVKFDDSIIVTQNGSVIGL